MVRLERHTASTSKVPLRSFLTDPGWPSTPTNDLFIRKGLVLDSDWPSSLYLSVRKSGMGFISFLISSNFHCLNVSSSETGERGRLLFSIG